MLGPHTLTLAPADEALDDDDRDLATAARDDDDSWLNLSDPDPRRLKMLLKDRFGHDSFRGCQEEVISSLVRGEDALVVMPTGAGKSLCYQMPGLVRDGCTVVVSPLIALMDDQVRSLTHLGLAAEAVHSGRDRMDLRAACQRYLDGALDFLFVSPERLRSQRFRNFLTRRVPSLIAVDEAHCISQWGHDFRPDYRLLSETLSRFASTPVLALTATATERVQEDITVRLGRENAQRFIHGFRRDNLAVEFVEASRSVREGRLLSLLDDQARRPAIVYVPTRKLSEQLADSLGKGAVSYHAGMDNGARERSQRAFTEGKASVVVATSAFGMGIDKADVRTVVHMGLPSSVEAYYQEIGRAGRDRKPARAILFYSWADRKLQESLFDRSYPATPVLQQVYRLIGEHPMELDELQMRARCNAETFERVLDQLRSTEAVVVAGWPTEVSRGPNTRWALDYDKQRARKRGELEDMTRLIEASGCRMCGLVGHFGDRLGSTEPCGHCDICAPEQALARSFRACTGDELTSVERVVDSLRDKRGVAKGRLFNDLPPGAVGDRKAFERIVDGLIRAGFARPETCRFDKDGKEVAYIRLHLTEEGWEAERPDLSTVQLEDLPVGGAKGKKQKKAAAEPVDLDETGELVAEALRAWRGRHARERGVPAFMVLNNRALASVAAARPQSPDDLLGVHGIGPRFVERYGEEVLKLVRTEVAHS